MNELIGNKLYSQILENFFVGFNSILDSNSRQESIEYQLKILFRENRPSFRTNLFNYNHVVRTRISNH